MVGALICKIICKCYMYKLKEYFYLIIQKLKLNPIKCKILPVTKSFMAIK